MVKSAQGYRARHPRRAIEFVDASVTLETTESFRVSVQLTLPEIRRSGGAAANQRWQRQALRVLVMLKTATHRWRR